MPNQLASAAAKAVILKVAMSIFGFGGDAGFGDILSGFLGFANGGKVPGYPTGGQISSGIPYNQGADNRLIAAQAGEFMVKRNAVNTGSETALANLNATGKMNGGGNTWNINVSANNFDESFVRNKLIPMLDREVRYRGATLTASAAIA